MGALKIRSAHVGPRFVCPKYKGQVVLVAEVEESDGVVLAFLWVGLKFYSLSLRKNTSLGKDTYERAIKNEM